eukprot:10048439-Alexandrium_andersonii.AAC.1
MASKVFMSLSVAAAMSLPLRPPQSTRGILSIPRNPEVSTEQRKLGNPRGQRRDRSPVHGQAGRHSRSPRPTPAPSRAH